MKPPRPGYGKEWVVKWLAIDTSETMYSGAMTQEEAERVARDGHWHHSAAPTVEKLRESAK